MSAPGSTSRRFAAPHQLDSNEIRWPHFGLYLSRNEEQVVIRSKVLRSSGWEVKNDLTGSRLASPRFIIASRVSQGL
jgi:hypothetical protein